MNPLKNKILQVLETTSAVSSMELAEILHLEKGEDYKALVKTISQMEKEKTLEFTKKGKLRLPQKSLVLEGTFRKNDRGFGFVTYDPEEEDVYIGKDATGFALDGDEVAIDILHPADPFLQKGAEGKVVAIKKHHVEHVTGEFVPYEPEIQEESSYLGYLLPKEKTLSEYQILVLKTGLHPVAGNIVTLSIATYPSEKNKGQLTGAVTQILGHKNDPGMDILSLVVSLGIPTQFPEDVLKASEEVPETISPAELEKRVDRRNEVIVTIDGEDAKDLDDAVTVKKLANGHYFLGVHIADVSHYVTENSPIDQEAYARGTSVYLTDRVIPMLPQRLSNGICSLNPKVDRLTLSCEMEIDLAGRVVTYDIFPSVIKTTERMTYTSMNKILEEQDEKEIARYANLVPMFTEMAQLHHILENMRNARGAINFEDREAKVVVDEAGHPLDIVLRKRGVGERLIESFMLAANETVAAHFERLHLPFIYRIHEAPKSEKMERFFDFVTVFGLKIKGTKNKIDAPVLQKLLKEVADKPEGPVISTMLLRSMQQAKYSVDPLGHYGLGAEDYTHFTSPIRRYPDLMVHRLIHYYEGQPTDKKTQFYEENLPEIAQHTSQMERKAVDAERMVDAMKKAEFLQEHVGETFEGVISSVTKFGFFVELPNTIEGLVHISTLVEDYFHFVERQMALVGEHTGLTFKLGEKVKVKVTKADPVTREIDFAYLSGEEAKKSFHKKNFQKHKPAKKSDKKTVNPESDKKTRRKKNKKTDKNAPYYTKVAKAKAKKKRKR